MSKVDHEWKLFKIGLASFINGFCKMNVEYMSSMTSLGMISKEKAWVNIHLMQKRQHHNINLVWTCHKCIFSGNALVSPKKWEKRIHFKCNLDLISFFFSTAEIMGTANQMGYTEMHIGGIEAGSMVTSSSPSFRGSLQQLIFNGQKLFELANTGQLAIKYNVSLLKLSICHNWFHVAERFLNFPTVL